MSLRFYVKRYDEFTGTTDLRMSLFSYLNLRKCKFPMYLKAQSSRLHLSSGELRIVRIMTQLVEFKKLEH